MKSDDLIVLDEKLDCVGRKNLWDLFMHKEYKPGNIPEV
jgi:hypothetical protein